MNTIQHLFEVDDKIKKLYSRYGQNCYKELRDFIDIAEFQEDKQNIFNQLWKEIFEVGIELAKKSAYKETITKLFKPIDIFKDS